MTPASYGRCRRVLAILVSLRAVAALHCFAQLSERNVFTPTVDVLRARGSLQYLKFLERFSCGNQDVKEAGLPAPWEPLMIE